MRESEPSLATSSASELSLVELFDDKDFDITYSNMMKIPEYFLMAWIRSKDCRFTSTVFTMVKNKDKFAVRKIHDRATGLHMSTRITLEMRDKRVMSKLFDELYHLMGSPLRSVFDAIAEDGEIDWEAISVWGWDDKDAVDDSDKISNLNFFAAVRLVNAGGG